MDYVQEDDDLVLGKDGIREVDGCGVTGITRIGLSERNGVVAPAILGMA
jgi:hypothetical protein